MAIHAGDCRADLKPADAAVGMPLVLAVMCALFFDEDALCQPMLGCGLKAANCCNFGWCGNNALCRCVAHTANRHCTANEADRAGAISPPLIYYYYYFIK